jgi:hypothetical protein
VTGGAWTRLSADEGLAAIVSPAWLGPGPSLDPPIGATYSEFVVSLGDFEKLTVQVSVGFRCRHRTKLDPFSPILLRSHRCAVREHNAQQISSRKFGHAFYLHRLTVKYERTSPTERDAAHMQ